MLVILDDGPRRVFSAPFDVIRADVPAEVPAALAALGAALEHGHHVAGWLSYELGYVLEPRLAAKPVAGPLLRLGVFGPPKSAAPCGAGRAYAGPLRPEWDAAQYAARFARVKDYIEAGDIYQANLSFRAAFAFVGDARVLYERLLAESGAGHCGYIAFFDEKDGGERQIVSLSPELFFDLTADGRITAKPMKGTSARKRDDGAERLALSTSEKDRAENLMIVDLLRNDLSRIAEAGSVEVKNLFEVETYPTLHAMVSTVTARKRADAGPAALLKALFPCGSVTGAPKIRAMEILRELESSPRGAYCGAIGHFAPDGSARFNVAIRTLTISGGEGELGIGGGVVQDSRSESEYAECLLKARFFETARKPLQLIETLRFENGFGRLEAHLARLENSAPVFGVPFDRIAARKALDEAVAGRGGALRVRLTLDEAGRHDAAAYDLPASPSYWTYAVSPQRTDSRDKLLRHKTNWRELYESEVKRLGSDEVVFVNERGEITEGARSNIFVARGGVLLTPPSETGLLAGCLRAELIADGRAREALLTPDDLLGEVYFGNSLRGLIAGKRI